MNDKIARVHNRLSRGYTFLLSEVHLRKNDDPKKYQLSDLARKTYNVLGQDLDLDEILPLYKDVADEIASLTAEEIEKGRRALGELEQISFDDPEANDYHANCLEQIKRVKILLQKTETVLIPKHQRVLSDSLDCLLDDFDNVMTTNDSDYHNI